MKKALIALCAAAALAMAGNVAVPTKAEAHVWWWIPAAIVGGVVLGATIAGPRAYAAPRGYYYEPGYQPSYAPRGQVVYAQPQGRTIVRSRY
jgi:hypothetical protein